MPLSRADYYKYIGNSPVWQAKRRAALKRADYRCQVCNKSGVQLDVHHRTYERLGEERDDDLTVLCHDCHTLFSREGKLAPPVEAVPPPIVNKPSINMVAVKNYLTYTAIVAAGELVLWSTVAVIEPSVLPGIRRLIHTLTGLG